MKTGLSKTGLPSPKNNKNTSGYLSEQARSTLSATKRSAYMGVFWQYMVYFGHRALPLQ